MTDPAPTPPPPPHAVEKVAGWLRALIDPDQVVELRALKMHGGAGPDHRFTSAGTFRGTDADLAEMAKSALTLSGICQGVYYTLNPLHPSRFVVQAPRVMRASAGQLVHDKDVLERRWLLVDIDPVKPPEHKDDSATDEEKARTLELAGRVRDYLAEEGWPRPILCDSGNGHHLIYRLAGPIPVDPAKLPLPGDDVLRRVLMHLAAKFNGEGGTIDTAVFNPGRIVKLPGTHACKGVETAERPWRRAKVLEIPT